MKLLRLKITDSQGFRSLQSGFEYVFRRQWDLQDETSQEGFAPFVCAGANGSGKSNLLEALAAIFYQLEILRVQRDFLPKALMPEDGDPPEGKPDGFELEYLIDVSKEFSSHDHAPMAHVRIIKQPGSSPKMFWLNLDDFLNDTDQPQIESGRMQDGDLLPEIGSVSSSERNFLLPQFVLGYSSGENEILSLPFFKMRFIQFDEYWNSLKEQQSYPGHPETRLAYMDNSYSQAILLCNMLMYDDETLMPFQEDMGLGELKEFRIVINRNIAISSAVAADFIWNESGSGQLGKSHPVILGDGQGETNTLNILKLLEADASSSDKIDPIVTRLKRCATCIFEDEETDTLYLDFYVNEVTREAFRENFDFEINKSPVALFQAFQVLLTLNLYSVSEKLKADLYTSSSLHVNETVPVLASDERVMRFKFVKFKKDGIEPLIMMKNLSDGEQQLLHSLGLCLLFKNTNSLFLLDEPETHFNPDWRSNFITRLRQCFPESQIREPRHEMLITTHTPFLISDSRPEKVLVFKNTDGVVEVTRPDYNTLGASINKITMNTFDKWETIGGYAQAILEDLRTRFEGGEDKEQIISEIQKELGDSVEKVMLIKTILDSMEAAD